MTSPSSRPSSIPGSLPQSPTPKYARLSTPSIPPNQVSAALSLPPDNSQQYNTDLADSQRPPFQPFFTLVSDTTTSTIYHPRHVHYLFSDDDPELLTTACLDALHSLPDSQHSTTSAKTSSSSSREQVSATTKPSKRNQLQVGDPTIRIRENRILLLDVDESGTAVIKAHSLTPSWQVLNTTLVPAPTWEAPNTSQTDMADHNDGGMMLRIEGTDGGEVVNSSKGTEEHGLGLGLTENGEMVGEAEFQSLMVDFDERMQILRTIVGAGGISLDYVDEAEV